MLYVDAGKAYASRSSTPPVLISSHIPRDTLCWRIVSQRVTLCARPAMQHVANSRNPFEISPVGADVNLSFTLHYRGGIMEPVPRISPDRRPPPPGILLAHAAVLQARHHAHDGPDESHGCVH